MKGLVVRAPWIHWLLDGSKDWEIRGRNTTIRGRIAVILAGSGLVLGTVDLVDCLALAPETYYRGESHHRIPQSASRSLPYPQPYAWVMGDSPALSASTRCCDLDQFAQRHSCGQRGRKGEKSMTCVICNATATIVRLWNSEEPALGEYGLCEGCDSTSGDCRVCGALLKDRPDHRRYRVVHESPFDTVAHLWGFCSTACEALEEMGQWAPEYCDGCGRDIPAYALGEGRLPAQFSSDLSGERLCLRCRSTPVELED